MKRTVGFVPVKRILEVGGVGVADECLGKVLEVVDDGVVVD
jgi:hypothetical protein